MTDLVAFMIIEGILLTYCYFLAAGLIGPGKSFVMVLILGMVLVELVYPEPCVIYGVNVTPTIFLVK